MPRIRWDTPEYRAARRALKAERREVCEHPRCQAPWLPIDYDSPRYVFGWDGRRRENPWAFDADHVTPRAQGGASDLRLRPCHARCNRSEGGRMGAARTNGRHVTPVHTRRW